MEVGFDLVEVSQFPKSQKYFKLFQVESSHVKFTLHEVTQKQTSKFQLNVLLLLSFHCKVIFASILTSSPLQEVSVLFVDKLQLSVLGFSFQ
jgi:hypothetical protein